MIQHDSKLTNKYTIFCRLPLPRTYALYLSTRMLHFMSRFIWRHYLRPKIDPYSQNSSLIQTIPKNIDFPIESSLVRSYGKLRKAHSSEFRFNDDEDSLEIQEVMNIDPQIIHDSKTKANFVHNFFRQSLSVVVMMLASSQIIYAFIVEPETLAVILSIFKIKT